MDIINFIMEEALILIPVLMILGKIIKNTPRVKNWTIPYILLVIGVALTSLILGFGIESFIQGVLVTGTAVFGHQLIKQAKNYHLE
ncbi:Phage holin family Hol44, holin superfamily V [Evansella caseinilytica]|uniref:Phage holin family Hol44, holin superfamily V n=1 Tax=Evansella caseinilytica TaxID=1503961 RepID=A0A1H3ULC2_9BACI|nr:phage holin family protein [Evansella caseinilytica]SDZ63220.1 Phage holin family Hol44, holin superfamily V [Evansella caseinilytica]